MLINIFSFLLDIAFGLLAGTCLLRLAMQRLRAPFGNPAGRFVIAMSNWIVLPLRKALPALAGWDSASLVAALALALAHQALLWGLMAVLGGGGVASRSALAMLLMLALFDLLRLVLSGLFALLLVSALLSWLPGNSPVHSLGDVAERLCAPLLGPLRRRIPLVGGIDLSTLVAMVLVQIAQMLLGGLQAAVLKTVA